MRPLLFALFFTLLIAVGFALQPAEAQSDNICPEFVERAVVEVGDLCENLGRNVACYGHSDVETVLYPGVSVSRFNEPSDRIELASLNSIHTAPLNEAEQRWGIALLSAQANLPNTAPGQNVVMMLVGDASLENQVAREQQLANLELVTVNTRYESNLRAEASVLSSIMGAAVVNTTLGADMLSEDGAWVRIPQPEGDVMWISRDVLYENPAIDSLPQPAPTQMSAMQSFYFNAGIGQSSCSQASGTLFIQGPNNIRVDLAINGVEISIGSTIALSFESESQMRVATLSGTGYVDGTVVPAGYAVTVDLDGNRLGVADSVSVPLRMDETALSRYALSEAIPENLLHYRIDLQPIAEIANNGVGAVSPIHGGGVNSTAPVVGGVVETVSGVVETISNDVVDPVTGIIGQSITTEPNGSGVNVNVDVGGVNLNLDVGGESGLNLDLELDLNNNGQGGLNLNLGQRP